MAVISDIHGNLAALDAVLVKVAASGADVVVCLGDLAWKGPAPAECVERLRALGCPCVGGNGEAYLLAAAGIDHRYPMPAFPRATWEAAAPYLHWHLDHLGAGDLDFFSRLPLVYRLTDEAGRRVILAHGTPRDCFAGILTGDSPAAMDHALEGIEADWLLTGHTHIPMIARWRDTTVVNPGGVGFSLDGNPLAAFALVDTATGSVSIERTPYDVDATLALAAERGFCFPADEYRGALTTGRWVPIPWEERAAWDV